MATILVVEDEKPIREFLTTALREEGYRILQAYHGRQALEVIARDRPDLVITDAMMPLMDGVELCRFLKADASTATIPIILMSAAGPRAAEGAGAQAYIAKPFDLDEMDTLVHRWLVAAAG